MSEEQKEGSLVLEGKIFYVETDANGKEVTREELDGELCMQALVTVLDETVSHPVVDALMDVLSEEEEEQKQKQKVSSRDL